jgi:hypothetical protein
MRFPAIVLALIPAATLFADPLTQSDRDRELSELQTCRKQFLEAIAGLSPAQWTYKAGPDYIGSLVMKQIMGSPADRAKAEQRKPGITKMDEGFLVNLLDRSQKANAPGEIVPKGIYKTPSDAAVAFQAARDKTLNYVLTTHDALREHFATPFPGFEMDGVQGLLMIAGHNERPVLQMQEVKQSPGYPGLIDDRNIKRGAFSSK